jgi:hypothetical protein
LEFLKDEKALVKVSLRVGLIQFSDASLVFIYNHPSPSIRCAVGLTSHHLYPETGLHFVPVFVGTHKLLASFTSDDRKYLTVTWLPPHVFSLHGFAVDFPTSCNKHQCWLKL